MHVYVCMSVCIMYACTFLWLAFFTFRMLVVAGGAITHTPSTLMHDWHLHALHDLDVQVDFDCRGDCARRVPSLYNARYVQWPCLAHPRTYTHALATHIRRTTYADDAYTRMHTYTNTQTYTQTCTRTTNTHIHTYTLHVHMFMQMHRSTHYNSGTSHTKPMQNYCA